jgi:S1-C subfamily serine protease
MENEILFLKETIYNDALLLDSYSQTVIGVVGTVAESVVHIEVTKKVAARRTNQAGLETAFGSGFIISSDGYIVTNNHVIENSESVKVSFADGRKVPAEIKGTDPSTDIGILKIYETGLKALSFADSDKLHPGQIAIAKVGRAHV